MALKLVTGPTTEPVTLAEARLHCRVDNDEEDALLVGYLITARDWCEGFLQRRLITQTVEQSMDLFPRCVYFETGPVQSIDSISYVDASGVAQTLAATEYQADTTSTICRIKPAYGKIWPITRRQLNAVIVRAVVGYGSNPGDTPESIRTGILQLVGHWFENREAVNVGNIVTEIPLTVRSLVSPYRVFY